MKKSSFWEKNSDIFLIGLFVGFLILYSNMTPNYSEQKVELLKKIESNQKEIINLLNK